MSSKFSQIRPKTTDFHVAVFERLRVSPYRLTMIKRRPHFFSVALDLNSDSKGIWYYPSLVIPKVAISF